MAATRLIALHVNKGKTAAASIKDRLDYAENPEKTDGGELISSYECDPHLAWQEFMLDRNRYLAKHDRVPESDVIGYQIRQSFKPGEITPEEANKVGYELAMRFTKGKHAFVVSTHTDRAHIHNHILYNAVDLQADRKFKNFFLSAFALRRLSDTICVEHGLSIIEEKPRYEWQKRSTWKKELSHREILRMDIDMILEKAPDSFEKLLQLLEQNGYEIKHGKQVSVRSKKMERFIRFRSLGTGYSEAELRTAIEQKTIGTQRHRVVERDDLSVGQGNIYTETQPGYSFSLMKDFEQVLQQKKGKGYENWARHFNNTQAAEVLIFLQENNIDSYEKLDALAEESTARFHSLSNEIKTCEARLKELGSLKKAITDYSKTRSTYEAYRKAGYSKKFYESHREEITIHQAAKKVFDTLPSKKIPKMKELSAEYAVVLEKKKAAYNEYRAARDKMKMYTVAQKNVNMLLGRESVSERNVQPSRDA